MKGYRIEVSGYEFAVYVVAETASKAKGILYRHVTDPASVAWSDFRCCRRYPGLDGKEEGIHATYQIQWGEERTMYSFANKTEIHPNAKEANYDRWWY